MTGRNLAERGDVVVVSINHRLNVLGFLDLRGFDERYANSANVGMLDIVAALEWVQNNIEQFGGDRGHVTMVFGQSGGGSKVNYLMVMPSARGLFHKAVVMSAIPKIKEFQSAQTTATRGAAVVRRLGLNTSAIDGLQNVPYEQLAAAWEASEKEAPALMALSIDGRIVPSAPFDPTAPDLAVDIPLLVGNTLHEGLFIRDPTREALTETELRKEAERMHGAHATCSPRCIVGDLPYGKACGDPGTHGRVWRSRSARADDHTSCAQVSPESARLRLHVRVANARPGRTTTCLSSSELPFFFDNTDRCAHMTGGTTAARELAAKVSGALIQFARTGNPTHSGLPKWPAFRSDKAPTMVFDNRCEVKFDRHDCEARDAYERAVNSA